VLPVAILRHQKAEALTVLARRLSRNAIRSAYIELTIASANRHVDTSFGVIDKCVHCLPARQTIPAVAEEKA
jgi:hypothetical protein